MKNWLVLLTLLTVILLIFFNNHGIYRLHQLRREQARLSAEIARLEETKFELEEERSALQTDMAYIERLAREKYHMVKKGEKVFHVVDPDSRANPRE